MERERRELHELAECYGFRHPSVISKSVELDQTLNEFHQKSVRKPTV